MSAENSLAIRERNASTDAGGSEILRAARIYGRDGRHVVIPESGQVAGEWEHHSANNSGMIQSEEVADFVRGDGLQIFTISATRRVLHGGVENDVGFDDLSGKTRVSSMPVAFAS